MRRYRMITAALVAATCCSAMADAQPAASLTESNRAIVADFSHRFYEQRDVRGAFEAHVAPDYVQHNPHIGDGRDTALAGLVPLFATPGTHFEIKRIMVDGDTAVVHLRGQIGPEDKSGPVAIADIFRLENGKIVEHWDVIQPITPSTANPHPFF